jgi:hypothetical protein
MSMPGLCTSHSHRCTRTRTSDERSTRSAMAENRSSTPRPQAWRCAARRRSGGSLLRLGRRRTGRIAQRGHGPRSPRPKAAHPFEHDAPVPDGRFISTMLTCVGVCPTFSPTCVCASDHSVSPCLNSRRSTLPRIAISIALLQVSAGAAPRSSARLHVSTPNRNVPF